MTRIEKGYTGLTLLLDLNSDRIIAAVAIAAAFLALALFGFQYATGHSVELLSPATATSTGAAVL